MSDDLGKKVQQIAQMLGQDNVPDNVKELVSLISASLNKGSSKGDTSPGGDSPLEGDSPPWQGLHNANEPMLDTEAQPNTPALSDDILNTTKSTLRQMNTNDPRINLLNAIKPFMNNNRQKKIGNCIQLLQIAGFSRLLNDEEK